MKIPKELPTVLFFKKSNFFYEIYTHCLYHNGNKGKLFYSSIVTLEKNAIAHKPDIPTSAYIILIKAVIFPNRNATRLKSNNPISPQLIAPIITSVNAIQFIVFINYLQF